MSAPKRRLVRSVHEAATRLERAGAGDIARELVEAHYQYERRVAESATPEPLPPVLFCGFSGGGGGLTSVSPFSADAIPVEPSPPPTDDVFYNADGVVAACPRCNEGIFCGAEHRHPGTGLRMTVRAGDAVLHEALDTLAAVAKVSLYAGKTPVERIAAMSSEMAERETSACHKCGQSPYGSCGR